MVRVRGELGTSLSAQIKRRGQIHPGQGLCTPLTAQSEEEKEGTDALAHEVFSFQGKRITVVFYTANGYAGATENLAESLKDASAQANL